MRTLLVIAGTIVGIALVATWFGRETRTRRTVLLAVPAGISFVVALALAGSALVTLRDETTAFARAGQIEVGRLPQPLPEALVEAARNELRPGDTWTLYTIYGRCRDDALRYFWLAFRLLPNAAECEDTPSVIIAYRIGDLVPELGAVVASGKNWAVLRP